MCVCLGGSQNSNHVCFRNPLFFSDNNLFVMTSFSVGEYHCVGVCILRDH